MMNNRLLNFAEYLKEELKIDLSDKKLEENLEALLLVADQAIWNYCDKGRPFSSVINDLMDIDGYTDSLLYGVAAMLLSGMDATELTNLKKEGNPPKVKFLVKSRDNKRDKSIGPGIKDPLYSSVNFWVKLKKEDMYKSDVEITKVGQIIPDDQFKVTSVPGTPGEMKSSELLIKIAERNAEMLVSAVGNKGAQANEVIAIHNNSGTFSLEAINFRDPLKFVVLIPPMAEAGQPAAIKLASKTPYIKVYGPRLMSATELKDRLESDTKISKEKRVVLVYDVLEIEAGFVKFESGGSDSLNMDGWKFSEPKYKGKGPFKNADFSKKLNAKGLPWWLTTNRGWK
jgi:hypothetical protein